MKEQSMWLSVDLDSTLADTRHRKGIIEKYVAAGEPVDWDEYARACLDDPPTAVVSMVLAWQDHGGKWLVTSGRSEGSRPATEAWLAKQDLTPEFVYLEDDTDLHNRLGHTAWKVRRVMEISLLHPIFAHVDDWAEVGDYLNAHTHIKGITVVPPGMVAAHKDNPVGMGTAV